MWGKLKKLLARMSAPPEWRGCAVYVRSDGMIFVFAQARLAEAQGTVTHALSGSVASATGAEAVGRELIRGIEAHDDAIADDVGYAGIKTAPLAAGFKGWTQLELTTRHLTVASNGQFARAQPFKVHPDGGLEPLDNEYRSCPHDAQAIGQLLLDTLKQMPKPAGIKPPRSRQKTRKPAPASDAGPADDTPVSFGYKCAWLAIPTDDSRAVADALGLRDVRPSAWAEGVQLAEALEGVFVTPAIGDWTLVVGKLPEMSEPALSPLLERLSGRFEEAQYFGSHRVVGYVAWARAQQGRLVRAYFYLAERDEVVIDQGERTAEEESLELRFSAAEIAESEGRPDEEHVIRLAREWSLNPLELEAMESRGQGLFGQL